MRLLDIIMGYDCNSWCRYCTATDEMRRQNLSAQAIRQAILDAAKELPQAIRFGGGEPTKRRDLIPLVRLAREMGIPKATVQSNGYLLQYREYVQQLKEAGVTHFNISVRGHDEATHNDLTTMPGTFPAVLEAIGAILDDGLPLTLDVIVTKQTAPQLEELVAFYAERGVVAFNFWHLAMEGKVLGQEADLMPTFREIAGPLAAALDLGRKGELAMQVYYVPFCMLPGYEEHVWMPMDEDALVVTPGATFRLEGAQIDLGRKVAACEECRYASRCMGVRPSYLERFGDREIKPLK